MKKHDLVAMKKTKALFARKFSAESDIGKYWNFLTKFSLTLPSFTTIKTRNKRSHRFISRAGL